MKRLVHESRQCIKALRQSPSFSLAVILTLALGIGANGAIFTAISSVLLKPLAYPASDQLVQVYNTYPRSGPEYAGTSIPDYLDRKQQADALDDLFIYTSESYNMSLDGQPQRLLGYRVSASMFSTLQVQPVLGSAFTEANLQPGAERVAVISHQLWQDAFGGDPDAVGQTVRLHGEPYEVLGVMPRGFIFPNADTRLWTPFAFTPEQRQDTERGNEFSASIGRLKPDASIEQLNAQMDAIVQRVVERLSTDPELGPRAVGFLEATGFTGRATYWHEQLIASLAEKVWLLQWAVLLVLLIACANVSNLQLVRLTRRQREFSLRAALGAGFARLAGQLLLESLLLALAGMLVAVLIAVAGIQLIRLAGLELPDQGLGLSLDLRTLVYMFGIAVLAALASALIPVLVLGRARMQVLREGGRGSTGLGGGKWLQQTLVVVQTALALALLIGSALMLRTFINLGLVDPGFSPQQVMTARISLPDSVYVDDAAQNSFYQRLVQNLRTTPGIQHAGVGTPLPFSFNDWTRSYSIEGEVIPDNQPGHHGHARVVDADYFPAMGIELLQGRLFTAADDLAATPVVVVDRFLAEQRFPDSSPLGQRITHDNQNDEDAEFFRIIGVVESVRHNSLDQPVDKETFYYHYRQSPVESFNLVVKGALPSESVITAIRTAVRQVDPELPLYRISSLSQFMNDALLARQAPMLLLLAFAAVALLLAAIGIYSVLSFMVAQRRREIGVRMAIGAPAATVVSMILRHGGLMLAIGCGIGVLAALLLSQLLSTQLYGVAQTDIVSYVSVIVLLGGVGLFACWWPARRAATVEPMEALRYE